MESTRFEGKAQQANLLLDAGFNALMPEILTSKTSLRKSNRVEQRNLVLASEGEPSSNAWEPDSTRSEAWRTDGRKS
ncbi:hypothetical protein KIN20_031751 [Parelaphostrongylus tenuis]|uniref:Uncharacterized protein n=1 Tax=Parelaphostrongylus tenuis TaxID=148309 RepID=A0AAD5R5X6_PARTN|nr:hypothetical protein KIN20_031751 [Parelaphostrongylus tenuis]